ncbi:IPT/TIG domain-containing protein [Antrihabitans sp. YC3-6]|uniref:IPT/TIG domain-containing protein n=1 Tax=Antrihabitans stalagmiti TaxID=2799499 RepID=A0A934NWY4_9NOCA|nr:IPT/TIG domain-containing protein [Antrihabitans stalagmiti]MBJ8342777.1 IPT/TIG domain-containing protein [Antrihabitans stalagmiti]
MADSANVSVATPRPGGVGVFYRAPLGTTAPTDAIASLSNLFKDHGYVGESGIVNSASRDVQKKKSFGGATVATLQNDYTETYQVTLLEDKNAETLRTVFGDSNVEVDEDGFPIKVRHNKSILPKSFYVVDTIDGEGMLQRDLIEIGQVTTVGDITKVHTDTVEYTLTIECFENADGDTVVELREPPSGSSSAVPTVTGVTPTGNFGTAGGQLRTIRGRGFDGTTGITIGGTAVTAFQVLTDNSISVITPAKTAGPHNVIVTDANGPSAAFAVTYA